MSTYVQNVHLSGECHVPRLTLQNDGKLFFPPSYSGVSSRQRLSIKNNARVPVEYECKVPAKYREIALFDPAKGVLAANEEKRLLCTFTHMKKREYVLSVPLHVKHLKSQADMNRTGFST